jgi:hypothetical protein
VGRLERGDQLVNILHALEDGQAVLSVARRCESESELLHECRKARPVRQFEVIEVDGLVERDVPVSKDDELAVPSGVGHADERLGAARQRVLRARAGKGLAVRAAAGDEGQEQREQQDEGFPRNPHDDVSCVWFCG